MSHENIWLSKVQIPKEFVGDTVVSVLKQISLEILSANERGFNNERDKSKDPT